MDREALIAQIELRQELERRENERYPALRFARCYHRNTRGQPMDFATRPYLLSMYKALPAPELVPEGGLEIVIKKCVQMGISEWAICAVLAYAGEYSRAVLYVLPKFDLKYTFVSNRLDKPIANTEHYQALLRQTKGGAKTKGMKHFGGGVIKVVGSNVATEFVEYPADVVIIDEADQCDQSNIGLARDRLKGPGSLRIHIKLGNPTIESAGLQAGFDDSNQMEWYVPCPDCGQFQEIKWFGNVMRAPASHKPEENDWPYWELIDPDWHEHSEQDIRCYCRFCGAVMNRNAEGLWYEENPGAKSMGFHLSKVMDPTYPLYALYKAYDHGRRDETAMQQFFNYDLGISYSSATTVLSRETIYRCVGDHHFMDGALGSKFVMGVDVGTMLHYWIEEVQVGDKPARVVKVDFCKSFDTLHQLMRRFNIQCCVIDARPESRKAKEFAEAYRYGRVWRCDYEYHGLKSPQRNWNERLLRADRTISMDISHGRFIAGDFVLPKGFMTKYGGEIVKHLTCIARVKEVRPNGSEVYVWDNQNKPDHWRHAANYATIAQHVKSAPPHGLTV